MKWELVIKEQLKFEVGWLHYCAKFDSIAGTYGLYRFIAMDEFSTDLMLNTKSD